VLLRFGTPVFCANFMAEIKQKHMSVKHEIPLKHKKSGYLQFLGGFFICGTAATIALFVYVLVDLFR